MKYKTGRVAKVHPKYKFQRCHKCGFISEENRKMQSLFKCIICGHEANADVSAALNILALGTAATGCRDFRDA
ncbi:MAG: zinc ribbon domain-containing protein [Gammaproteobacteria bacterium]|nr:zinc ribbon domain-containing protein [Gammaproteobacteria bacterium]